MSSLDRRLARLEAERQVQDESRLYSLLSGRGVSAPQAREGSATIARALREAPPRPTRPGKVDIAPTIRRLAQLIGADEAEAVAIAARAAGEMA